MIAGNAFLEWADVFGNLYGTGAADAERALAAGRDVVLVIDVQGARQVRKRADGTVAIFVMPPSYVVLEQRLRGRSKDPEAAMQRRLQTARDEVAAFTEYDYVIVNDELDACVDRLRAIVIAERTRLRTRRGTMPTGSCAHSSKGRKVTDRTQDSKRVRIRHRRRCPGAPAPQRLHAENTGSDKARPPRTERSARGQGRESRTGQG